MNFVSEGIKACFSDIIPDCINKHDGSVVFNVHHLGFDHDDYIYNDEEVVVELDTSFRGYLEENFSDKLYSVFIIEKSWSDASKSNDMIRRKKILNDFSVIGCEMLSSMVFYHNNLSRFSAIFSFRKEILSKLYRNRSYTGVIIGRGMFEEYTDKQNAEIFHKVTNTANSELNWLPIIDCMIKKGNSVSFLTGGIDYGGIYIDTFLSID